MQYSLSSLLTGSDTPCFLIAPADIRERFGNVVLIFIVCMRNLAQFNWDLGMYWMVVVEDLGLIPPWHAANMSYPALHLYHEYNKGVTRPAPARDNIPEPPPCKQCPCSPSNSIWHMPANVACLPRPPSQLTWVNTYLISPH